MTKPIVIPGWVGWGNARPGLEVYAGTDGDRFRRHEVDPRSEGPVMARAVNASAAEGMGAILVVIPERIIGNAEATLAWAERIADAVDGEVVQP